VAVLYYGVVNGVIKFQIRGHPLPPSPHFSPSLPPIELAFLFPTRRTPSGRSRTKYKYPILVGAHNFYKSGFLSTGHLR
jgi:hypothetical protein